MIWCNVSFLAGVSFLNDVKDGFIFLEGNATEVEISLKIRPDCGNDLAQVTIRRGNISQPVIEASCIFLFENGSCQQNAKVCNCDPPGKLTINIKFPELEEQQLQLTITGNGRQLLNVPFQENITVSYRGKSPNFAFNLLLHACTSIVVLSSPLIYIHRSTIFKKPIFNSTISRCLFLVLIV
jgi:hypothetical protein